MTSLLNTVLRDSTRAVVYQISAQSRLLRMHLVSSATESSDRHASAQGACQMVCVNGVVPFCKENRL